MRENQFCAVINKSFDNQGNEQMSIKFANE